MTRRLIEGGSFPLEQVSAQSSREKTLRHGHISTLHPWWARRPLAMARAITLALLLPDAANDVERHEQLDLIATLSNFDRSNDGVLLKQARSHLRNAYKERSPRVLDPFAGGGALSLEALRLGCEATALDLNPVAYVVQLCCIDFPMRFAPQVVDLGESRLVRLIEEAARYLRDWTWQRVAPAFAAPAGRPTPNGYIWVRTTHCANPACGVEIPLLSSRWLDDATGRTRAFNIDVRARRIDLIPAEGDAILGNPDEGTVRKLTVTCPVCQATIDRSDLRKVGSTVGYGERLAAIIEPGDRRAEYRCPLNDDLEAVTHAEQGLDELTEADGLTPWPDEDIPYSNLQVPHVYGFRNWEMYFNARQRYVLGTLAKGVRVTYDGLVEEGVPSDLAKAVATYLGIIVNRIADRDSTFSSWTAGRQTIRSTFARQGISNVWDYAESNPFGSASGSWDQAVQWVTRVVVHCQQVGNRPASVVRGDAMSLPFEDASFDAVITDPPYYDSVQYGDLSDFFYVWLKRSVGFLYPEHFATPLTPKSTEIVSKRLGKNRLGAVMAEEYERRLAVALAEMRRVVKPDGIATVVFAHTSAIAWEALIRTLVQTGWAVTASWPISTEFSARSRALGQPSLASSVCLVCRPQDPASVGFYDEVRAALSRRVRERLSAYWDAGLSGSDLFVAAIGPAVEVFGRYEQIQRLDGSVVAVSELLDLTQQVVADFTLQHLLNRETVGTIDDLTRFYILWRWSYGTQPVPADQAYKLAQVFGVEIDDLRSSSSLITKRGDTMIVNGPEARTELAKKGAVALPGEPIITTVHRAMLIWSSGATSELSQLLSEAGELDDPGFWGVAQALAELVPEGTAEKMFAAGLAGSRGRIKEFLPVHAGQPSLEFDP